MNNRRCYTHTVGGRIGVWSQRLAGITCVSLFTAFAIMVEVGGILQSGWNAIGEGGTCIAAWAAAFGWIGGLALFNMFPDICMDERGLYVSFLFGWKSIPWEEVTGLHTRRLPPRFTTVSARKITPLHYVYGWIYGGGIRPSFIISPTLQHREELTAEIQRRIREKAT